ncbi:MAG TPA: hypothetical protein VGO86_09330 [Candidatus Dormibacteraeota bacterium]
MYVLISTGEGGAPQVSLEEPDDCRRFHVTIRGLDEQSVRAVLGREGAGTLQDRDTAWVSAAAARRLAGDRVAADWPERFEAMIRFAATKGWLSEDGQAIRAHCEWSPS